MLIIHVSEIDMRRSISISCALNETRINQWALEVLVNVFFNFGQSQASCFPLLPVVSLPKLSSAKLIIIVFGPPKVCSLQRSLSPLLANIKPGVGNLSVVSDSDLSFDKQVTRVVQSCYKISCLLSSRSREGYTCFYIIVSWLLQYIQG